MTRMSLVLSSLRAGESSSGGIPVLAFNYIGKGSNYYGHNEYASLEAIPSSVAESNKGPVAPEAGVRENSSGPKPTAAASEGVGGSGSATLALTRRARILTKPGLRPAAKPSVGMRLFWDLCA